MEPRKAHLSMSSVESYVDNPETAEVLRKGTAFLLAFWGQKATVREFPSKSVETRRPGDLDSLNSD